MTAQRTSDPLSRALAVMAVQHGVASTRQVRECGVTWEQQRNLLRRGTWRLWSPGVLADNGAVASWEQRAHAALLMPGARPALAGGTAGRVHRLDGCLAVDDITVVIPNSSRLRAPSGIAVLRSRRLTPQDLVRLNGLLVTSVPVTLIHLQVHGPNPEKALDSALRQGHRPDHLRAAMERWRGLGVQGPPEMLHMLHQRVGTRLPRSWFQRLASRLLAECGLVFVDEYPVHNSRGRLLAELDLACPALKVGVECQSWEHHGSPAAQQADLRRKRALRQLGWEIVELWWSDLDRIDAVVADIRVVLERAILVHKARNLPA